MGWVEGVVTMLTGLAWPAVILVAVIVLKRELGRLIGRLTRLSGAGVEVDFSEKVDAVGEIAEEITPDAPAELPAPPSTNEGIALSPAPSLANLLAEAELHPVGGIIRAWNLVEMKASQIFDASHSLRLKNPETLTLRRLHPLEHLKMLRESDLISSDLYQLARQLSDLRNQVVHGRAIPTTEQATSFAHSAWRVASALSNIDPNASNNPT